MSIYGVGEASHRYFGKRMDALSLEEAALLVGMIKGPNTYSPLRNPTLAKGNVGMSCWVGCMNWALSMRWPVRKPSTRPVRVMPPQDTLADAPFFVDYLLRRQRRPRHSASRWCSGVYDPRSRVAAVGCADVG